MSVPEKLENFKQVVSIDFGSAGMAAFYCKPGDPYNGTLVDSFKSSGDDGSKSETAILVRVMTDDISDDEKEITSMANPLFVFTKTVHSEDSDDDEEDRKEQTLNYGIIAFGDDATSKYKNLWRRRRNGELKHPDFAKKYLLFKAFKPYLYDFLNIKEWVFATDGVNYLTLEELIIITLKTMIKETLNQINKDLEERDVDTLSLSDIFWVFGVPSIKQFMSTKIMTECLCSEHIGLTKDNILIATESLATAYYVCKQHDHKLNEGDKILICDIGGGTCDVSVVKLWCDNYLEEIVVATGIRVGGLDVIKRISQLLLDVFGDDIAGFPYDNANDWKNQLQKIEDVVKTTTLEDDAVNLELNGKLCRALSSVSDVSDIVAQWHPPDLEEEQYMWLDLEESILKIDSKLWSYLFSSAINQILDLLHKTLRTNKSVLTDLKYIVLSGGFSNSKYLRKAYDDHRYLSEKSLEQLNITSSPLAVGKGLLPLVHYNEKPKKKKSGDIDLLFLIDGTGSMQGWIDQTRNDVSTIIQQVQDDIKEDTTYETRTVRVAYQIYRDYTDSNRFERYPTDNSFTTNIDEFKRKLQNVTATGGGDSAEDVLGGLNKALNSNFNDGTRFIFHILDAPNHHTDFHEVDDNYKTGLPDQTDPTIWYKELLQKAKDEGISYYIAKLNSTVNKMIKIFTDWGDNNGYKIETSKKNIALNELSETVVTALETALQLATDYRANEVGEDDTIIFDDDEKTEEKLDIEDEIIEEYKTQVCIDFGTHGTMFFYVQGTSVVKPSSMGLFGMTSNDRKTYTSLLLSSKGQVKAFGDSAQIMFEKNRENDRLPLDEQDMFFRFFKMSLYNSKSNKKQDIKTEIKATNGRLYPSRLVVTHALREVSKAVMKELINNDFITINSISDVDKVQWIITVPAIWTDRAKQFMQICARDAGLIKDVKNDNLIIVYEPDSASICTTTKSCNLESDDVKTDDTSITLKKGDKYILLDLGGGTADIACHQVVESGEKFRTKEILSPDGGAWGSTQIDKAFIGLLKCIFGNHYDEFKEKYGTGHAKLLQAFENLKASLTWKKFRSTSSERKKKIAEICQYNWRKFILESISSRDFKKFVTLKENRELSNYVENKLHKDLEEFTEGFNLCKFVKWINEEMEDNIISTSNKKLNKEIYDKTINNFVAYDEGGNLDIHVAVMRILFDVTLDKIIFRTKQLLQTIKMKGCKCLFLAGGMIGKNDSYVRGRLNYEFGINSDYKLCVTSTNDPILAVVEGGCLLGMNRDYVSQRKYNQRYGIKISMKRSNFDLEFEKEIPPLKFIKGDMVTNIFYEFELENSNKTTHKFKPVSKSSDTITIELCCTDRSDAIFVTEDMLLARKDIRLPRDWLDEYKRNNSTTVIPITFCFDSTTIKVRIDVQGLKKEDRIIPLEYIY